MLTKQRQCFILALGFGNFHTLPLPQTRQRFRPCGVLSKVESVATPVEDVSAEIIKIEQQRLVPDEIHQMGPVERANLVAHLALISQRLSDVEALLKARPTESSSASKSWLEFLKVLFSGWPAFGLLFMLLFYVPVRDAINAIPEKVKSADEIGVLGVSLKNTIRVEAEKVGAIQLSETLPTLSPAAVEFLLRASRDYNALVSFSKQSELLKSIRTYARAILSAGDLSCSTM